MTLCTAANSHKYFGVSCKWKQQSHLKGRWRLNTATWCHFPEDSIHISIIDWNVAILIFLSSQKNVIRPQHIFYSDCIATQLTRRRLCILVVHDSDLDWGNVLHLEIKFVLQLCSHPSLSVFLMLFNNSHNLVTASFQGLRASPQYHFFLIGSKS
jgi:hypothetical protein